MNSGLKIFVRKKNFFSAEMEIREIRTCCSSDRHSASFASGSAAPQQLVAVLDAVAAEPGGQCYDFYKKFRRKNWRKKLAYSPQGRRRW
jgi:hypothetical protein